MSPALGGRFSTTELEGRQEPQGSSPFLIPIAAPCIVGRGESGLAGSEDRPKEPKGEAHLKP